MAATAVTSTGGVSCSQASSCFPHACQSEISRRSPHHFLRDRTRLFIKETQIGAWRSRQGVVDSRTPSQHKQPAQTLAALPVSGDGNMPQAHSPSPKARGGRLHPQHPQQQRKRRPHRAPPPNVNISVAMQSDEEVNSDGDSVREEETREEQASPTLPEVDEDVLAKTPWSSAAAAAAAATATATEFREEEKAEDEEDEEELILPPVLEEEQLADVVGLDAEFMLTADSVFNPELSWMAFNWRVLYMAQTKRTPLFERLRFIAITDRNLDEFFCKRAGGLKRQEAVGVQNLRVKGSTRWYPGEQLRIVSSAVRKLVKAQHKALQEDILPELEAKYDIRILRYEQLNADQKAEARAYFKRDLEGMLTPLAVDPGHPFPYLTSFALNVAVTLRDPFDGTMHFAILPVPTNVRRFRQVQGTKAHFVPVEEIIIHNLDLLFGGMEIAAATLFRATRNADVARNEEEAEDLLDMINDELRERRFAPFVRLEIEEGAPDFAVKLLTEELALVPQQDVYFAPKGLFGLGEFDSLPVTGIADEINYPFCSPISHRRLASLSDHSETSDLFNKLQRNDILVHHPYQSFKTSVQYFLEAAARDPQVVAIKMTLYRSNSDSPIVRALELAAEKGKQVAVLVELKARFDEARNAGYAQRLENAGCNVCYGLVGLKTHSKAALVVRQEEGGLKTYVHLGTGNYNPTTANVYTDLSLMSAREELGLDVIDLFKYLTGYHRQESYRKLLVAPNNMRRQFLRLCEREIENAKAGLPAEITIKVNGIDCPVMVGKLYEASMAGVRVNLIVRGICMVRPGVPGLSENIRVVSVIGRYLEHHRIYMFHNGGEKEVYIGSADWMTRNLARRVEVAAPVEHPDLKKKVIQLVHLFLHSRFSWEMLSDGRYKLLTEVGPSVSDGEEVDDMLLRAMEVGAQMAILEETQMEFSSNKKKRDGRILRQTTVR